MAGPASFPDPAVRRPPGARRSGFIGREREMATLAAVLEDALAGRGGVALLSGEPGIGKTRTLAELAALASARGVVVLWGHCYEGAWSPPYSPWAEAIGEYVRIVSAARLRRTLGDGAAPIARLVPAVGVAVKGLASVAALDPDEERARLRESVARFLVRASGEQPILLLLDDLHWADAGTVELLEHLARFLRSSQILVGGTYRDVDLAPTHPLARMLPVLRHAAPLVDVRLRGMSFAEAERLLAGQAGQSVSESLVRRITSETGGNPFFMGEVLRHLLEEGQIRERDGLLVDGGRPALHRTPPSVREVVERRVARLSPPAGEMLRLAAAFTGGFSFNALQAVTGLDEEALLDCLDEALRAGLIREEDGRAETYDFTHALVRHALSDRLNASRRVRLHRRIAEALDRLYAGRPGEHAAEVAGQYHASIGLPGAERGIPYALAAAERATAAYAHAQAAHFLRMARDLAAEAEPAVRAEVLRRLAVAEAEALMLTEAVTTMREALVASEAVGFAGVDPAAFLARIAVPLKEGGAGEAVWLPVVEEGLRLAGDRRDLVWARLMLTLYPTRPLRAGDIDAAIWTGFDPPAVRIAREQGDEEDYAHTWRVPEPRTRAETDEILAFGRRAHQPPARLWSWMMAMWDLIHQHGAFAEAASFGQTYFADSERHGAVRQQGDAAGVLVIAHATLGDFTSAHAWLQRARERNALLGPKLPLQLIGAWIDALLAYLLDGDWSALARSSTWGERESEAIGRIFSLQLAALGAVVRIRAGDSPRARSVLDSLVPVLPALPPDTFNLTGAAGWAATAVWESSAVEHAPALRRLALDLIAAGRPDFPVCSHELTVARMAALLGDREEASRFFDLARERLEATGQRPLRAIVDHDEARWRVRTGIGAERVPALLDAAVRAFVALGMDTWATRAAALAPGQAPAQAVAGKPDAANPFQLSPRELDVLRCVAEGLSNQEIAERLVLSAHTVHRHVANIFAKLDVNSRAAAVALATRHGLI